MKILFISGREPAYVRNAMILKGLRLAGADVLECTDMSGSYPARFLKVLGKYLVADKSGVDLVFAGFLGQPLVPLIRRLTRKPIVFDAFLSVYDTMCFDRKRFSPGSAAGRFFFMLDKLSCQGADRVILDTDAHIEYFTRTFGLPEEKFRRVFVGADDSIFYPREAARDAGRFRVFYYASYLPLHGMEHVVRAAKILERNREIEFRIVGSGPRYKIIRELAKNSANVDFVDWVPYEMLPSEIARADVCLGGHFSDIEKAKRVISGKAYQFIAMKKPVIVGDCPANRELFADRENALIAKMADAASLAEAILNLRDDAALRGRIAEGGYRTFVERCSPAVIAKELGGIVGAYR